MLTRIIKLGLEGFSIVILALLVNGHNAWLTARSAGGLFDALESISGIADGSWELVGMNAYRLAFVVAMIVTVIEVIKTVYRLLRAKLSPGVVPAVVIEKKD
jgi:hypothetical protein